MGFNSVFKGLRNKFLGVLHEVNKTPYVDMISELPVPTTQL
jgi:hypothetical protein